MESSKKLRIDIYLIKHHGKLQNKIKTGFEELNNILRNFKCQKV